MVNLLRRRWPGVSLTGKLSPNFNLKNMILPYTKDFSWKQMNQICQILKKKLFYFFPEIFKNIEEFYFIFPTFISSMQPNLAKLFFECSPLWLHYKNLKRTLLKLFGDFCLIKKILDSQLTRPIL
jgi:hypothetical protein